MLRRLRLSKNHVIPSQCAHWRGALSEAKKYPWGGIPWILELFYSKLKSFPTI